MNAEPWSSPRPLRVCQPNQRRRSPPPPPCEQKHCRLLHFITATHLKTAICNFIDLIDIKCLDLLKNLNLGVNEADARCYFGAYLEPHLILWFLWWKTFSLLFSTARHDPESPQDGLKLGHLGFIAQGHRQKTNDPLISSYIIKVE